MSFISNGSVDAHLGMGMAGTTSDFTVMTRYKLNALPASTRFVLIATKSGATDDVELDVGSSGAISLASYQSGAYQSIVSAGTLSTNVTYHLAIVHKQGVSSTLYINGVQVAQIAGITYTMDEFAIGVSPAAPSFSANRPRTWLRALTGAEVASEVSQLSPQTLTSIWDWWALNGTPPPFVNGQINGSSRAVATQPNETYFTGDSDELDVIIPAALPASYNLDSYLYF